MIIYFERVSRGRQLLYSPGPDLLDEGHGLDDNPPSPPPPQPMESLQSHLEDTHISAPPTAVKKENIVLDSFNIHRLIITSALVSIKFLSDVFYTNLHVSRKI